MTISDDDARAPDMSDADARVLRSLAERLAAETADPIQAEREREWRRHNALRPGRPLVVCDIETPMWREIVPEDQLQCRGAFAQRIEDDLRQIVFHAEQIRDDWVQLPCYFLPLAISNDGFGVETRSTASTHALGAVHFDPVIVEPEDIERIRTPRVTVDRERSRREQELLQQVFGDLLPVRLRGWFVPWFAPIDQFAEWRGIENLMMDLLDDPDWLHEALERLTSAHLGMLDQLVEQNLLGTNHDSHFVGSGGQGHCDELPAPGFDPERVRPQDLWGQATAQIFSEVSPAMHEEFSLPYDRRWLERFGLACYGCCEPLHRKVDVLRQIPNLRRISMSPWVDVSAGAAAVGRDYVFSRKPNPAIFATDRWDEERVRAGIRADLAAAAGCNVEFIMKDTRTCRKDPARVVSWARICREECERVAAAGSVA